MGLYKREGSSVWWYAFRCRGKLERFSTEERDRGSASAEAARRRLEIEANAPRIRTGSSLADLAQWPGDRAPAEGAGEAQLKTLERDRWAPLIDRFGDVPVAELNTYDAVQGYIIWRRETHKVRGQTIRREVAALRRGLLIAKRKGVIRAVLDEWPKIKNDPPKESQRGKMHAPDVLRAVVAALPLDVQQGVAFALLTGLRYAELRRVRAEYIEPCAAGAPTPALLKLPAASAKTRKERTIGLTPTALALLEARAAAVPSKKRGRMPKDYSPGMLFPRVNYRNLIVKACTAAGYPRVVTMRDLRHTFLTLGLLETGDLKATMAAGGHTKETTALGYQHSTDARTASVSLGAERLLLGPAPSATTKVVEGITARDHSPPATQPPVTVSIENKKEKMAGRTGLEPAASGVTGGRISDIVDELSARAFAVLQEIARMQGAGDHSVIMPVSKPRIEAIVEGWLEVDCKGCGRRVEVYDQGAELKCPGCSARLDKSEGIHVA